MIGQMQGKFQMVVMPGVGHMLQEVSRAILFLSTAINGGTGRSYSSCRNIGRVLEEE